MNKKIKMFTICSASLPVISLVSCNTREKNAELNAIKLKEKMNTNNLFDLFKKDAEKSCFLKNFFSLMN
ncbi:hypothetical protein [Mesomycoplasma lagogenitalium]|uniref:Lipoprotein n=1 Tax=Mesomycoplasma lagogenitalium TaxID=171286 RepID=A0ABY8LU67_9BACT|nr:hypothetical protein [Mesomycoplasma lagogenitalium]WGI36782.1 hypothetical protein QEG99_00630 [Mesomycoplasma lagogenitalium]